MTYILMIWTVVAMSTHHTKTDWRPIGEFNSQQLCQDAAKELSIKSENYRCVRSK